MKAPLGLAAAALLAGCALFPGPAERGRAIADRWCAECHRVAPDQPSGMRAGHVLPSPVDAPSFASIAARPQLDAAALRRFMAELHLPMPTFRLTSTEQEDVILYILSLKPAAS